MIDTAGLNGEELLVLAGDNHFELSLPEFAAWSRAKPQPASAVPLHDVGDFELATHYGIATTDGDDRIVEFVEKPSKPASTLASTLIYLLPPGHGALIDTYLGEGHSPDNAGSFLGWLADGSPCTATRSCRGGTTSGATHSCSRPTTGFAARAECPSARHTASTELRDTVCGTLLARLA